MAQKRKMSLEEEIKMLEDKYMIKKIRPKIKREKKEKAYKEEIKKNIEEVPKEQKQERPKEEVKQIEEVPNEKENLTDLPINYPEAKTPEKFNVNIPDANSFKKFINAIEPTTSDNAKLIIKKDGIHISSLNKTSIAMIQAYYPSKYMSKWDIDEGIVNINTEALKKQLSNIKNNDSISLSKEDNKLKLHIINNTNKNIENMELQMGEDITPREAIHSPPNTKDGVKFSIKSKELNDIINKAKKSKASYLYMETNPNELKLSYKAGSNLDGSESKSESVFKVNTSEKQTQQKAAYDIDTLKDGLKGVSPDTELKISFKGGSESSPIKINYTNKYYQEYTYWIAPYMENY